MDHREADCALFQVAVSCWRCSQCMNTRLCALCSCSAVHSLLCRCSSQPPARREILKYMLCVLNTGAGTPWSPGLKYWGGILVRNCIFMPLVLSYPVWPKTRSYVKHWGLRIACWACCTPDWHTGRGKPNYLEENVLQCQFVHDKSHISCPGLYN